MKSSSSLVPVPVPLLVATTISRRFNSKSNSKSNTRTSFGSFHHKIILFFSLLVIVMMMVVPAIVEGFSFSSSVSTTSQYTHTIIGSSNNNIHSTTCRRRILTTTHIMAIKYSKSIDATNHNDAGSNDSKDDDTTIPIPPRSTSVVGVVGSMSNVEEEKEEEYINALLVEEQRIDDSAIQYNGYSMTSGSSEYSRYLYGQNRMKKKLNFGIDSTKKLLRNKMTQKKKKRAMDTQDMNEDGYIQMRRPSKSNIYDRKMSPMVKRVIKKPITVLKKIISKQRDAHIQPGTLILVRHGESTWNKNKTFTGWADPDLTLQGTREVEHAARLLMEGGYHYDIHIVFTSRLTRAIRSTWILLQEFNEVYLPVFKSWRLNGMYHIYSIRKKEDRHTLCVFFDCVCMYVCIVCLTSLSVCLSLSTTIPLRLPHNAKYDMI